jgi:hypothetical protein
LCFKNRRSVYQGVLAVGILWDLIRKNKIENKIYFEKFNLKAAMLRKLDYLYGTFVRGKMASIKAFEIKLI